MPRKVKVAFQGVPGSFSELAIKQVYPDAKTIGFATFKEVIDAVKNKKAELGFLPVENSTAGRVASSHLVLQESGLKIVGEKLLNVKHCLISVPGTSLKNIKYVYSHPQALAQCSDFIKRSKLKEIPFSDTALAVKYILDLNNPSYAAIASCESAKTYGAKILKRNIHNHNNNTTRFLILSRKAKPCKQNCIKALYFELQNRPAALFKALSGFATEKINVVKIESFVPLWGVKGAEFYLEYEVPTDKQAQTRALEELEFFSNRVVDLGVFEKDKKRSA